MLLLEPHADTRELYHLWLSQHAFRVRIATSGAQALAELRLLPPDIVVVEPMITGGGIDLIRALRREPACADAVVIVLTTLASGKARRHVLEAGADAYLLKPCAVAHLCDAIVDASRDRLRLVTPDAPGERRSRVRLRRVVRRCRAIRERLAAGPRSPAPAGVEPPG